MPYVFVEEIQDGQEEADVVTREDFESVSQSLFDANSNIESLTDRAIKAESDLDALRRKYANAFMKTPVPSKEDLGVKPDTGAHTFEELFR